MRRWCGLALCLGLCLGLLSTARAERGAELYEIARENYHELANDGPRARNTGAWRRAGELFGAVERTAPDSAKADEALYMVGACSERAYATSAVETDRETAVRAYLRLAERYSRSTLADDALLRAGRIRELQGRTGSARELYGRVLEEYSGRDMAAAAERRLDGLERGASMRGVRSWSAENYTRVVLDLDRLTPFQASTLPANPGAGKPPRIFLDLARSRLGPGCADCTGVADGLVRQVRAAQFDRDTVRVVLDLNADSSFRAFPLDSPPRIVVDVYRTAGEVDVVGDLIAGTRKSSVPAAVPQAKSERLLRIVVDPGHGGKDPGAVGARGLLEKDVVLSVARQLAAELPRRLNCQVKLTRTDDRFLPLEQRTAVANAYGADLFISVHANASRSSKAKGIETYYLDRASDRASRKMAARENASTEADLAEMEHILADVILSSKINDSRRLAETVQRSLVADVSRSYGPVRDLGVKRGPFYVLTGAMMPAILIETSFITNPVEAQRLANTRFHEQAAAAVAAGVERYVEGG